MKKEKIVLAYSGGLDTSVAIKWLQERYDFEVITVIANLGEEKEYENIAKKAKEIGASKSYVVELEKEFASDYLSYAIKSNALYEGEYPLISALSRALIAKHLVRVAHQEGASAVAHGCTGKGNDQIRFDLSIKALDPCLKIIVPMREWPVSREEAIDYAKQHQIPLSLHSTHSFSIDQNLWGRSCGCGVLEDPWIEAPEEAYEWTTSPLKAPDTPQEIAIEFKEGLPIALNGKYLPLHQLILELNQIAGQHGVGRIDLVEDRIVGIKSREIYEAPAAMTLIMAHKALEAMTLIKETMDFKPILEKRFADLVYEGLWYSPLRSAIIKFMNETQKDVTGIVKLKLYKGKAMVIGRKAEKSLYQLDLATYKPNDQFDHSASEGFIKLYGLPLHVYSSVHKGEE